MNIRLSTLTNAELEAAHASLSESASLLRALGDYFIAASVKSRAQECNQTLLVREADRRQFKARQLELVPDPPPWA